MVRLKVLKILGDVVELYHDISSNVYLVFRTINRRVVQLPFITLEEAEEQIKQWQREEDIQWLT